MGLKDLLKKTAGLVVEFPADSAEETAQTAPEAAGSATDKLWAELERAAQPAPSAPPPTKTVEQIVRDTEGPNLDQIQVPAGAPPPVIGPEGQVDFLSIYRQANLPPAPFTAEQMLEMLASLPPELPLATRRQTVSVTLSAIGKAIGASPETIVADASRKLAALSAYTDALAKQTVEMTTRAELEIAALQAQIEEKRKAVETAKQQQQHLSQVCAAEADRLDDVVEFFSLDVPPSKYSPPATDPAPNA